MADSLSQLNYPGLLSALEQNLSDMPDVSEDDVAELAGKTTFTHHEQKFLYRAAQYAFDQKLATVQNGDSSSSGALTAGSANVDVVLTFDQNVTVTGTPQIALTFDNANAQVASYFAGDGSTDISFGYVTLADANDIAAAGIVTANIDLNGGTMVDSFGKNVGLEFDDPTSFATITVS